MGVAALSLDDTFSSLAVIRTYAEDGCGRFFLDQAKTTGLDLPIR